MTSTTNCALATPSAGDSLSYVAVDISNKEKRDIFSHTLQQLHACGWSVGEVADQISQIPASQFSAESITGPCIIRCETEADVKHFDAIEPDSFAILTALGKARMEQELVESVADNIQVDKVLIGYNWTMVRAGQLCGIARSPERGTQGARTIRPKEGFGGKSLREIATYLLSSDALSRSLGLAAINAFWNRPEPLPEISEHLHTRGGLSAIPRPGDGVVIIGGFRKAQRRLPNSRIIEREPKPGDIAVEDAPKAYREASTLAITAQTLMNGSLESILEASSCVPERMLLGPSAPLCPQLLKYGLTEISGSVVVDPDATEQFICESGTMIMIPGLTKSVHLR
ncbi:DUF364 domain-containing protein [Vibrio sp. JC009]|uniref:Rossmann-like domain-containing protein n=1 Tax=Vibrio sp. JC009 TaxID=2912314 RepID=UPI0023AE7AA6|nr:DUF364 domain-containing protein [Vibrio sp. JC009]WED23915.1 DUF364 domain-containing protein [Vibrio sp. JC009]